VATLARWPWGDKVPQAVDAHRGSVFHIYSHPTPYSRDALKYAVLMYALRRCRSCWLGGKYRLYSIQLYGLDSTPLGRRSEHGGLSLPHTSPVT
jgi:hypothetical protein